MTRLRDYLDLVMAVFVAVFFSWCLWITFEIRGLRDIVESKLTISPSDVYERLDSISDELSRRNDR